MAAQRRAAARRKNMIIAGSIFGAVILVIGILVGVKVNSKPTKPVAATTAAPAAVVNKVTGVAPATLDTIGKGKVGALPTATSGQKVLTADGKPLVFYMGAEYCPYCAAERWPMIVALSRFGTFTNLGQTFSSSTDTDPNTPSFSFHGATYTSKYLTFQAKELQTNQPDGKGGYTTLDTLTADQQALVSQFDSNGSYPFVDFGNQALISGASYDPALLAGMTQDQVAAALADPSSAVAQAIGGTANAMTAQLCKLTGGQPANVCASPAVTAYNGSTSG
jgi:thiol-disulfide isomerase/thioredoxin